MAYSGQGQARSVYVVQRTFRLVRRGYDPEEVDRHLQLVAEWFRTNALGREAEELRAELRERERAVAEREQQVGHVEASRRLEAEAILTGARLRAAADTATGERDRAQAKTDAERVLREAETVLSEAREGAARLLAAAEREAALVTEQAQQRAGSAQRLAEAEETARDLIEQAGHEADALRAETEQRCEQELRTARLAGEQVLTAMRHEAAREAQRTRERAQQEAEAYAQRRQREIDRLVAAARVRQH